MRTWALITFVASLVAGCTPFPRYAYVAETRIESASESAAFSANEIATARSVVVGVAQTVGMEPRDARPDDVKVEELLSTTRVPPRRFLSASEGKLMHGLPLTLRAELSEDGRTLYFSLMDPNRGDASPTFERIDALLQERVAAAFPGLAITHEPTVIGPIWSLPP
jgi:hypothetical protein